MRILLPFSFTGLTHMGITSKMEVTYCVNFWESLLYIVIQKQNHMKFDNEKEKSSYQKLFR